MFYILIYIRSERAPDVGSECDFSRCTAVWDLCRALLMSVSRTMIRDLVISNFCWSSEMISISYRDDVAEPSLAGNLKLNSCST